MAPNYRSIDEDLYVYRGRNDFRPMAEFADQQVTLSFGADTAASPAKKYGPYPRKFLEQFFPPLRAVMLLRKPDDVTDAVWATTIPHEHFQGAELDLKPNAFGPIDIFFRRENQFSFQWPYRYRDPAQDVDMRDTWILADFLEGHAIKNVILDLFYMHLRKEPGFTNRIGKMYTIDKELIDYTFENKLWDTQFGRAVMYCIRKEMEDQVQNTTPDTIDAEVLPTFLENIFSGAEQDQNYLPWYFDLARMILMEMTRPRLAEGVTESADMIRYFCGVTHHHPGELECILDDPPDDVEEEDNDEDLPDVDDDNVDDDDEV